MRRVKVYITIGSLLIGLTHAVQSAPAKQSEDCRRLIVKYRDTDYKSVATTRQIRRMQTASGTELQYERTLGNGAFLVTPAGKLSGETDKRTAIAKLENDAEIEYAECDAKRYIKQSPNDPYYLTDQWYLRESGGGIRADDAWQITTGDNGIVTAVIDSGIQAHSDLDEIRILTGYDFISDADTANDSDGRDNDPTDAGDYVTEAESTQTDGPFEGCEVTDSSWHGTQIAGIIGAQTNNGSGIAGIDWTGSILPTRALGKCGGNLSDIIDAIYWSIGQPIVGAPLNSNPADVINLSLGGSGSCSNAEEEAIQAAVDAGALVVVAAGNEGGPVSDIAPANCPVDGMITVASSTRQGGETCYTNFGDAVDLSAPGGNDNTEPCTGSFASDAIYSTSNSGDTDPDTETYKYGAGTSFAAPMVAGAGALLKAVAPALSPVQIEATLKNATRAFPTGTSDGYDDCTPNRCGTGILDINQALVNATGADVTPEPISFVDQDKVERNTIVESNAVTASGIDTPVPIGIEGGLYAINNGAFVNDDSYVYPDDSVTIKLTASSQYSTTTTATLSIGNVSDTFAVTTVDPPPPDDNDGNGGGGGGGGHPAGLVMILIGIATAGKRRKRQH